jgi:hypothetical protein
MRAARRRLELKELILRSFSPPRFYDESQKSFCQPVEMFAAGLGMSLLPP